MAGCSTRIVSSTKQRRAIARRRTLANVAIAHERAGDVARQYNFHEASAQHYQDALRALKLEGTASPTGDRERILKKLVAVLFLSENPDMVNPLYDELLKM